MICLREFGHVCFNAHSALLQDRKKSIKRDKPNASKVSLWLGIGFVLGVIWRRMAGSRPVAKRALSAAPAGAAPEGEGKRKASRPFIPSSSTVAAFFLGAVLLVVGAELYSNVVSPSRAPIVPGRAELYVQDPAVTADLSVTFPLKTRQGESEVEIGLVFTSARQVPVVSWALVMSGDACFAERGECISHINGTTSTFLPPGAKVAIVRIGQPPFSANPKNSSAQIVYGTTKMDKTGGHSGSSLVVGYIKAAVVTSAGPDWDLTLPSYGRLPVSPLFDFPNRPGALDLSIPGHWHRPGIFEVDVSVNSPGNDSGHRVDVASPPLADPLFLRWQSGESVRGVIQRTDLNLQARQQILIFALGAVVGAAAALVLDLFQWAFAGVFGVTASRASRSWRAVRSKLTRAD